MTGDDYFYLGLLMGSSVSLLFSIGAICLSSYFREVKVYVLSESLSSPEESEEGREGEETLSPPEGVVASSFDGFSTEPASESRTTTCCKTIIEDEEEETLQPPTPSSSSTPRLSKREEMTILHQLRGLVGMSLESATQLIQSEVTEGEEAPTLHIRKRGESLFPPLPSYDPNVITIGVSDEGEITHLYGIGGVY